MKKIFALLLALVLVVACVACGTPKEIVKDKKFSTASYANYVSVKASVENMRTEFPEELDEKDQKTKYHITPKATIVVDVAPTGTYKTEFKDCVISVNIDAGQLGEAFAEIVLDENGKGQKKVDMQGGGWLTTKKTYIPTPNPIITVSTAEGRVKTHIPYNPEEDK